MKRNVFKFLFPIAFALLLFVFSFPAFAQSPKYFIITGKIIIADEILPNASIQIIKNKNTAISSPISSKGRFRLELDYNSEYKLTFRQEGHIDKTIVVNTEIPGEALQNGNNFPHFLMAVMLDQKDDGSTVQTSGIPVQHISYSSVANNFVRLPGIFDHEFAEESSESNTLPVRSNDGKLKIQAYQIF
jgi:hypothetical protein